MKLNMDKLLEPLTNFFTKFIAPILINEKEKLFDVQKLVDGITYEMETTKGILKKAEAKSKKDRMNKKVNKMMELVFKMEDVIDDYKLLGQEQNLGNHSKDDDDDIIDNNDDNIDIVNNNHGGNNNINDDTNTINNNHFDDYNNSNDIVNDTNSNSNSNNNYIKSNIRCLDGIWVTLTGGYKAVVRFNKKHGIACRIVKIRDAIEKIKAEDGYEELILNINEGTSGTENEEQTGLRDPGIGPLYKDEKELVGFKKRKDKIIKKLDIEKKTFGQGQFMLVIWGEPGVGKTTLARKIYEDDGVRKYFSCYAWITTTKPYKKVDLLKSLFKQFLSSPSAPMIGVDPISADIVDKLQENEVIITDRLRSYLQQNHKDEKGYFVVLDDVSEKEELCDILKAALVPNYNKGGRIIITTSSQRIANYWKASFFLGDSAIYNLPVLSDENATELFNKKAIGTQGKLPSNLEDLRNAIVQECDGLPFLIEKVGADFSTTQKWIEMYHNFKINPLPLSRSILLSKYHEMPSHLKPCFLYLCMFPKGTHLDRMRIVRLWIAEGFVKAKEHYTPEEAAKEYLNELVERGMIRYLKRDETERNRIFRLPNMWYHIMLRKLEDLNFCLVFSEKRSKIETQCRRFSMHSNFPNTLPTSTHSVSSILSFVRSKEFPLSWPLPQTLFQLKVLDLQDAIFDSVPLELGTLHNLKYLSFRNTTIKELPETINGLWNLQTLDLKQSPIRGLPSGIKSLNKLRYLLIGLKKNGLRPDPVQIPQGALRSFTELQNLTFVDGSSEPLLLNLRKLTQLRRLGIVNLKTHGEKLCQAIIKMKALRSLSINAENEEETLNLTYIMNGTEPASRIPPKFLERLYLRGSLNNGLPEWIPKLGHLVKLVLRNSKLERDPVPLLKDMEELLVLELDNTYDGEVMNFGTLAFKNLRVLRIKNLHKLERMITENGSMPQLRKLECENCPKLNKLPWIGEDSIVMQELLVLQLNNAYDGKQLFLSPPGFQKLEELYIKNLPNLENIYIEENALPHLQKKQYDEDKVQIIKSITFVFGNSQIFN